MDLLKPLDRVTLLGLGPSIYDWVVSTHDRFDLIDGETWTINSGAALFNHDLVFDMHSQGWIDGLDPEIKDRVTRRRQWLKAHSKPVVMPRALPEYPTSLTYPLAEVERLTGSSYFAVGVVYALALAHVRDVKRLDIYGLDHKNERGLPCVEYWIGRLVQKGCRVVMSERSEILGAKEEHYGY